ncbi:MAG TPA: hypothetical protein VKE40_01670 [Gemmataceae bacterium]|nr:hypothetical protein [Gemmataceae bacterium]
MRQLIKRTAGVSVVVLGLTAVPTFAAPPLPDKPRWEYAELQVRTPRSVPRPFDDGEDPAAAVSPTIRWTTGQAEFEVKDWLELADKLKSTAPKKGLSASAQKIYMLNLLGSEGWEMVGQQLGSPLASALAADRGPGGAGGGPGPPTRSVPVTTETWTFKRRVQ